LPPQAPPPKKRNGKWVVPPEIEELFRAHLVKDDERKRKPEKPTCGPTIAEVFDNYLDWCKRHREARTFDWYHSRMGRAATATAPPPCFFPRPRGRQSTRARAAGAAPPGAGIRGAWARVPREARQVMAC